MSITTYQQALSFIKREIPLSKPNSIRPQDSFRRAKHLLNLLDNPQDKLKTVHIAGTSGKGSTAMILAAILAAHGKKVGMTLSPHVYDIRERCQINGQLISKIDFVKSLNVVIAAIKKMANPPSYFETMLGLALMTFVRHKVSYAILETGMGGTYDASNTITRTDKLCLLTNIGYDHTEVLGKSLPTIAKQKAGIIQPRNQVLIQPQSQAVMNVFKRVAKDKRANLRIVDAELAQQANEALAAAAARYLSTPYCLKF